MNPDEDVPEIEAKNHEEIDDSVFASNYFVELADFVRYRFQNMHCFCMACHEPHRCGMSKDKDDGSPNLPIICGKDLCVFAFEEQKVRTSLLLHSCSNFLLFKTKVWRDDAMPALSSGKL